MTIPGGGVETRAGQEELEKEQAEGVLPGEERKVMVVTWKEALRVRVQANLPPQVGVGAGAGAALGAGAGKLAAAGGGWARCGAAPGAGAGAEAGKDALHQP